MKRKVGKRSFVLVLLTALLFASIPALVLQPEHASAATSCDLLYPEELARGDFDGDGYDEFVYRETFDAKYTPPSYSALYGLYIPADGLGYTMPPNIVIVDYLGGNVGCFKYQTGWHYQLGLADLDGYPGQELILSPSAGNRATGSGIVVYNVRTKTYEPKLVGKVIDQIYWGNDTDGIPGNEIVMKEETSVSSSGWYGTNSAVSIYHYRSDTSDVYGTVPYAAGGNAAAGIFVLDTYDLQFAQIDGYRGMEINVKAVSTTGMGSLAETHYHENWIINNRFDSAPYTSSTTDFAAFTSVPTVTLPKTGAIEAPAASATISGIYSISGWYLDEDAVSKVEVLVDGVLKGRATYGGKREDVYNAHPEYRNHNSGYTYSLNTYNLTNAAHTLTVLETNSKGVQTTLTRTFTINNVIGVIETPAANATIGGNYAIKGWFLDQVSKVEILVDGVLKGTATVGVKREDVYSKHPQYKSHNSGYSYTLNTYGLVSGAHTLSVRETNTSGKVTTLTRAFTINNILGAIEEPPATNPTLSGVYTVKGWALGVSKVEILVDNVLKGTATYGGLREDIYTKYPQYNNHNSGYSYNLSTYGLAAGNHTLTVRETSSGGSGYQRTMNRKFHVNAQSFMTAPAVMDYSEVSFDVVAYGVPSAATYVDIKTYSHIPPSFCGTPGLDCNLYSPAVKVMDGVWKARVVLDNFLLVPGLLHSVACWATGCLNANVVTQANAPAVTKTVPATIDQSSASYDIIVDGVDPDVTDLRFVTFSYDTNYNATNGTPLKGERLSETSWKTTVPISLYLNAANLTNTYETQVQTYDKYGNFVIIDTAFVQVTPPVVTRTVPTTVDRSSVSYDVIIDGVSPDAAEVHFPTWTLTNGKDDLEDIKAEKVSDTQWKATVLFANHFKEAGTYASDVVSYDKYGNKMTIDHFNVTVKAPVYTVSAPTSISTSTSTGFYDVIIDGVSPDVADVQFYTTAVVNGMISSQSPNVSGQKLSATQWKITVSLSEYNNVAGYYYTWMDTFDKYGNTAYQTYAVVQVVN